MIYIIHTPFDDFLSKVLSEHIFKRLRGIIEQTTKRRPNTPNGLVDHTFVGHLVTIAVNKENNSYKNLVN